MRATLQMRVTRWKANPRRWNPLYVVSRVPVLVRDWLGRNDKEERFASLDPPVEVEDVEILADPAFCRSVAAAKEHSCLDAARLANLWNMVQLAGDGTFVEVGSFRGGTALHLCNAIDTWHAGARFFSFDPFETGGFEGMTDVDRAFKPGDFTNTHYEAVKTLLAGKPRATVVQGFFPQAAMGHELGEIAFCHLDVDIYDATLRSLEYLAPRLSARGLIVVDDFGHREAPGVEKAAREFVAANPAYLLIPMFPCQAVVMPRSFGQS